MFLCKNKKQTNTILINPENISPEFQNGIQSGIPIQVFKHQIFLAWKNLVGFRVL